MRASETAVKPGDGCPPFAAVTVANDGVIPPDSQRLHKWNFLAKMNEESLQEDKQIH